MYPFNDPAYLELGGVSGVHPIVDRQRGPTCGFEAVENVIQLFDPTRGNHISGRLVQQARKYGALLQSPEGFSLDVGSYQEILADFGIASHWYAFDHRVLIDAVRANRVAIAVVDAHLLEPATYSDPESGHAIVVTNEVRNPQGLVIGYVGIDSNFPAQERWWSIHALARATRFPPHAPLLITDSPARWPLTADHYT